MVSFGKVKFRSEIALFQIQMLHLLPKLAMPANGLYRQHRQHRQRITQQHRQQQRQKHALLAIAVIVLRGAECFECNVGFTVGEDGIFTVAPHHPPYLAATAESWDSTLNRFTDVSGNGRHGTLVGGTAEQGTVAGHGPLRCLGEKCFRYFTTNLNWQDARQECLEHGSDLAAPTTQEENDFLNSNGFQGWIGWNDIASEGSWTSASGDALVSYTRWYAGIGEPNNAGGDEDCVAMDNLGNWYDLPCSDPSTVRTFICEKQGPDTDVPFVGGTVATQIQWPVGSIPPTFTICSVTRYTSTSSNLQQRLLVSQTGNWLHGHWGYTQAGIPGATYYDGAGNLEQHPVDDYTKLGMKSRTDWVVTCGRNTLTPGWVSTMANGVTTSTASGGSGNQQLAINLGSVTNEYSGWQLSRVYVWDYHLPDAVFFDVSDYLMDSLAGDGPENPFMTCVACEAGKYKDAVGDSACTACPANSNSSAGSGNCTCISGYTGPDGGACEACEAGKYKVASGSDACTACAAGSSSSEGSTASTACISFSDFPDKVALTLQLPYTISDFDEAKQHDFKAAMANAASTTPDRVLIQNITTVASTSRRLLSGSIQVDVSIAADSPSVAITIATQLRFLFLIPLSQQ